jgi:CRP-like cAMP-binding protein
MTRLHIDQSVVAHHFRASAFAMINCWLNQQRLMMEAVKMDLTELTIFLTVNVAGIQRLVRLPEIPEAFRGYEALPNELVGSISRRAIAEATGLPRETVRRTVNDLIRRGHLAAAGQHAVTTVRGTVRHEGTAQVPAMLAAEVQRMIDELARLGAVSVA